MSLSKKHCKKVRVDWYQVLYSVNDPDLISYFWSWYNSHRIKSKVKAAKLVLGLYYSTTVMPISVLKYINLVEDSKCVHFNYYEDVL